MSAVSPIVQYNSDNLSPRELEHSEARTAFAFLLNLHLYFLINLSQ